MCGRLTRDVELKYSKSGTAICQVSVAMSESSKEGDSWVEKPVFVDVTLFGKTAEVVGEYCSKGSQLIIDGKLSLDQWQDKDGNKRSKLKVIGDKVQLVGPKKTFEDAPFDSSNEEEGGSGF
jgi:single-strand DNA-binding protein